MIDSFCHEKLLSNPWLYFLHKFAAANEVLACVASLLAF